MEAQKVEYDPVAGLRVPVSESEEKDYEVADDLGNTACRPQYFPPSSSPDQHTSFHQFSMWIQLRLVASSPSCEQVIPR